MRFCVRCGRRWILNRAKVYFSGSPFMFLSQPSLDPYPFGTFGIILWWLSLHDYAAAACRATGEKRSQELMFFHQVYHKENCFRIEICNLKGIICADCKHIWALRHHEVLNFLQWEKAWSLAKHYWNAISGRTVAPVTPSRGTAMIRCWSITVDAKQLRRCARCNGCLHVTSSHGASDVLWDAYADVSTRFHGRRKGS